MITKLFLFNILVFNVIVDSYFYYFGVCKLTKNKAIRIAHWVLDGLFVAAILLLFALTQRDEGASNVLRQGFTFVYLLVYLSKSAYLFFSWPSVLTQKQRTKRLFYRLGAFFGILLFGVMLYGNAIGVNKLRVTEVEMVSEKIPESFDGFTIALIADLHVGNMRSDVILDKTIQKINEINPDVVLFLGDMVHSRTREVYPFRENLERLRAKEGIYAVMGNHDYGDYANWPSEAAHRQNVADLRNFYREIGWTLLDNESVLLRRGMDSIALLGVENWGEPPFPQYGKLVEALQGVEDAGYKILMTHNPNHWIAEVEGQTDIDLSFSGHTHAMQLAVKIGNKRYSPAAWRYKLWGGLYQEGEQSLYVNEGIGAVMIPFRLGATPELTIVTLKHL